MHRPCIIPDLHVYSYSTIMLVILMCVKLHKIKERMYQSPITACSTSIAQICSMHFYKINDSETNSSHMQYISYHASYVYHWKTSTACILCFVTMLVGVIWNPQNTNATAL